MYKLKYFTTGNEMCASDLENQRQTENINLQQVSSLSDMNKFHLPLSGTYKGDYAVVSMQNGDRFYIDKTEHSKITEAHHQIKVDNIVSDDVMVLFKPHELWRMAQKYNCDDFIQKIEQSKSLNKL
jgi:hypothetical protein